jgi:pyruvate dehydrogenase E2 component (dihydrolipoamide acetyltransferase)
MYEITMPKLSDSMQEGKIIAWKVKPGARIREGDVLAEVESDKATMELECFHSGVLSKIVHGDGSEVPVGEVIGYIDAEAVGAEPAAEKKVAARPAVAEAAKATQEPASQEQSVARAISPRSGKIARPTPETEVAGRESPPEPMATAEPPAQKPAPKEKPQAAPKAAAPQPAPAAASAETRIAASPRARKLAQEKGIDLSQVKGTGPGGRIIAQDIEPLSPGRAAPAEKPDEATPAKRPPVASSAAEEKRPTIKPSPDEELPAIDVTEAEAEVVEASYRIKTQARRVTAAKHVIPHFYITRSIDVTRLFARKEELKQKYGATITHLIMLAALKALKAHPEANRSYDRGRIIKWKGINLGLAVDADEGLTVAVIPNAQGLSLKEIVERTRALVEKARSGKLTPEERRHPTFTVSSLGMFDVEQFEPIINPPSAITLAVASALAAPVVKGDKIEVGRVMKLTLSCDHRIIDGVTAATFLGELKRLLENDAELLKDQ